MQDTIQEGLHFMQNGLDITALRPPFLVDRDGDCLVNSVSLIANPNLTKVENAKVGTALRQSVMLEAIEMVSTMSSERLDLVQAAASSGDQGELLSREELIAMLETYRENGVWNGGIGDLMPQIVASFTRTPLFVISINPQKNQTTGFFVNPAHVFKQQEYICVPRVLVLQDNHYNGLIVPAEAGAALELRYRQAETEQQRMAAIQLPYTGCEGFTEGPSSQAEGAGAVVGVGETVQEEAVAVPGIVPGAGGAVQQEAVALLEDVPGAKSDEQDEAVDLLGVVPGAEGVVQEEAVALLEVVPGAGDDVQEDPVQEEADALEGVSPKEIVGRGSAVEEKGKLLPTPVNAEEIVDDSSDEEEGRLKAVDKGKAGEIFNKQKTHKYKLDKFDYWTRDRLRFAKNKGKLAYPFSIDEAFDYLENQHQHSTCDNVKTEIDAEETIKNHNCSLKQGVSWTGSNPVSNWKLSFCVFMAHFIPVVAQQNDNQYLLWVVLSMTLLLLCAIVTFMTCHSCNKQRNKEDDEEEPFIVKHGNKEDDAPSIANLRHRLFGCKNTLPRQKGGGSEGDSNLHNYTVDTNLKIGSGSMSNVFIASYNGREVAAKIFQAIDNHTKNVLEKEFRILSKLKHENIIKVLHFDNKKDTLLLELCFVTDEKGEKVFDLKEWSQSCEVKSAATYASILKQATAALNYLHQQKVIHSDVKPQNILCTGDFQLPLLKMTGDIVINHITNVNVNFSDFGSAMREAIEALAVSKVSGIAGDFGTDLYRSPETFKRNRTGKTKTNDVYALAFTLADVLNQTPPGENLYGEELKQVNVYTIMQVKQENIVPKFRIPQVCDDSNFEQVSMALEACLDGDPKKRLDSEALWKTMQTYQSKIDQTVMKSPLPKKMTGKKVHFGTSVTEKSNGASQAMNTNDEKAFLNFHSSLYQCKTIDLKLSQATPGILITFGGEAEVDNTITEVAHFRLLLQDNTQYENLKRFEATNACAFYSTLIMDTILLSENWDLENAISKTRQIIMLSQLDFNHKRNIEETYTVEDAIGILGTRLILNLRDYEDYQYGKLLKPKDETDLLQSLSNFFINVKNVMKDVKHGFFYTVGELVFSFVIDYEKGTATLIDTHPLPHIENAVICCIDLKEEGFVIKEKVLPEAMSCLLLKRIVASKGDNTFDVFHQIDLATQDMAPVRNETQEELQDDDVAPDFNVGEIMDVEVTEGEEFCPETSFLASDPGCTSTPIKMVLRDYQQEVLRQVLQSKDILMVWPTGAGKTHTIISLIEETSGTTIILTPTLSLMMEYIKQLEMRSISYLAGSSLQTLSHQALIVEICKKTPRCILVTHEQMKSWGPDGLIIINEAKQIEHVIYDEIHCDLLWGTSFRPPMKEVHNLPEALKFANRIALTATPMGGGIENTVEYADLRKPFVSRRSLFRPNIKLEVFTTKDQDEKTKLLLARVLPSKKCIIFTSFTDEAKCLVHQFQSITETPVFLFTGNISTKMKVAAFEEFEKAGSGILIATSALGKIIFCMFNF